MQIKTADDKECEIKELQALLGRSDLSHATRKLVEQEIRNIRAGSKGEQEAAWEIEFYVRGNPKIMTIHDLRIECEGRVAQIDHLVITSLLDVWLCESKHFSGGVSINEYGEWSHHYQGGSIGLPSPIEQNKRHAIVLDDLLSSGRVDLPKRLGIARRPAIKTVVLLSKNARIDRPDGTLASHVEGLESVIKCDQFISVMDQSMEKKGARDFMLGLAWLGTIEKFARQLANLHKPMRIDWLRKFEIPRALAPAVQGPTQKPSLQAIAPSRPTADPKPPLSTTGGVCESCGRSMSPKEVMYCRTNAARLRGQMLCYYCQRGVRQIS
jgi:hypothetical protein